MMSAGPALDVRTEAEVPCSAEFERTLQNGSKSFHLAARLLPAELRADVAALYAYCRYVDDATDLAAPEVQLDNVQRLCRELDSIYRGEAQAVPVLAAFQSVVQRHRIPRLYPAELLAGMLMDAQGHRYDTVRDLLLYAYRVAGTVGLMMCHVLGVRDPRALTNAAHLGMAMQLTNICRDVAEDLLRGRFYVPRAVVGERLSAAFARRSGKPVAASLSRRLRPAVQELLSLADRYYASADRGLIHLSFRAALSVRAARLVYSAIGAELRRRRLDVRAGRAVVPFAYKLLLVCVAAMLGLLEVPRRLRRRFAPAPISEARRFEDVLLA